jgi:sn-glycerol 3-phosphate transport system substrate-binding protein
MTDRRWVTAVAAGALLLAACGGGGGGGGLTELAAASKPVRVTLWYVQAAQAGNVVPDLVKRFEASQDDVRVRLLKFPSYDDLYAKYRASMESGDLPDVTQMEETKVQTLLDSRTTIPMQACVDADGYSTSDFLPRATAYYTTDGVLRAMPWGVSNPILYYNKTAFRDAGLDPDKPPRTLAEVESISEKLRASGVVKHGISLKLQDYYNEFWYAKGGQVYVNNDNGRSGRATKAQLDTPYGLKLWTWWKHMVDSGLALSTPSADSNFDHLLALANGQVAMSIEASAALGPISALLKGGQYQGLVPGTAPLPGFEPGGGVPVGDGSLWITRTAALAARGAAWQLVKFFSEPASLAELAARGGYVPIRRSEVQLPAVQRLWTDDPNFEVAYDQLVEGPTNAATSGSLIGDYDGVRQAVTNGLTAMIVKHASPKDALARAQREADKAIADYNARVSG